ncbi:hypothetical protein PENSOL_c081G03372 [Penicillium solitum]|uniref:Uncharacterized protein n=1 Tax=Penicillium solitum TaxID=60172 RepID=A0A1V6QD65_9EURO|nr:uncharacterized protein PENSOL_c081G03372 [Penicillium solitum]OQD86937.1 hypothetical protein PENSOL_c081G03372 [Penicillium solitum]
MAWGLTAIIGAEPEYIEDSSMPAWLTLAEGVFQAQVARWDTGNCNGGLRRAVPAVRAPVSIYQQPDLQLRCIYQWGHLHVQRGQYPSLDEEGGDRRYEETKTNGEKSKWKSGHEGLLNTSFNNFFLETYGGRIIVGISYEISYEASEVCTRD